MVGVRTQSVYGLGLLYSFLLSFFSVVGFWFHMLACFLFTVTYIWFSSIYF
jgi:hypothetical protein